MPLRRPMRSVGCHMKNSVHVVWDAILNARQIVQVDFLESNLAPAQPGKVRRFPVQDDNVPIVFKKFIHEIASQATRGSGYIAQFHNTTPKTSETERPSFPSPFLKS